MTLLEKAKEMGIEIEACSDGGEYAVGCPYEHGFESQDESYAQCGGTCAECYAREYVEPEESKTLYENLEEAARNAKILAENLREQEKAMRHFETGAVRDSAAGKGRYDLLPWAAIHALAQHCERGAIHYGARNVDKGIPQSSLIDSAVRHVSLYIQGDSEPYHLVAALWNIAWACEQEAKRQHLVDLPERTEKSGVAI